MKLTLEFTEEEENRAKMAINGDSAHYALSDIDEMCRQRIKHHENSEEVEKFLDRVRDICSDFRID